MSNSSLRVWSAIAAFGAAAGAAASAAAYEAPRTAYGAPDLQGVWTNATITTLERPDGVDTLVLTPEQARLLEDTRAEFYDSYDSDPLVLGAEENDYGVVTSLGWEF